MKNSITSTVYDLIGVGFGPSNIALSIALAEQAKLQGSLSSLFLDKQSNYRWHGNTITDQSHLQISFLKDLVSLRNPTSPYSFVNYLQKQGRLVDFINLGTFYPSRLEFNDYLRWVAEHFSEQCRYGEEVLAIEPVIFQDKVKTLRVIARDIQGNKSVRETRALVVSPGGNARIPELFKGLKSDERVFHHSQYLSKIKTQPCAQGKAMKIAIIGGGQSAAEAFIDLNDNYPSVQADMILRNIALKPADSSPFVNEVFAPTFTDTMYKQQPIERERLLKEYLHTNYSVVDEDMIKQIYSMLYKQKVSGDQRHNFRCSTEIEQVTATEQGIELALRNTETGQQQLASYDAVILATGYERKKHIELLAPLADYISDFSVDRNYRLQTDERCQAAIYLQGCNESSHGLSDTLLSVLAIRSGEISAALYAHLVQEKHAIKSLSIERLIETIA
ncbi:MAG: SidA/IucD/PvdA family monooxygenase [Colwellia sp.]|nr:SidA/IucD/PvdA family monooxygenase [Colwellia sp.]